VQPQIARLTTRTSFNLAGSCEVSPARHDVWPDIEPESTMTPASIHGRRLALRVLDANRLRELVDSASLSVVDRRSRELLIQALADARGIAFSALLGLLTRDELKAMCRAIDLPDDGREKAPIVLRLLGMGRLNERDPESTEQGAQPSKKTWRVQVVDLLKRDELAEVVEKLDLEVEDRRVHQNLRDAIGASPVALTDILENLPRVRLKEICRVLGLDDGGKEKAPIVQRIARAGTVEADESEPNLETDSAPSVVASGPDVIRSLLGSVTINDAHGYWPAKATLAVGGETIAIDLHARVIGATGRNPLERRFHNPASGAAISPSHGRPCLLFGVWTEQGMNRAVLVAFDAYRRKDKSTRFSLFMPLSLLEEAADIGFVSHMTASGETIYAFRPESLPRYLDAYSKDANWGDLDPGTWARPKLWGPSPTVRPLSPPNATQSVEIRPKSGMFAAFARLNYKPWFALAELVDNAVQSFLANREKLTAAGSHGPLVIDIDLDDKELSVKDRAAGIRVEDFPRAFSPATPPSDATGLSEFGLGMKAAACWFANEWSVRTSAIGDDVEREIAFDVPKITTEGLDFLPIESRPSPREAHFTIVTMRKLRVVPRGSTLTKIKDHLASIYRLLIADGTVKIRLTANGRSEELAYVQPKLLVAPHYSKPGEPAVLWRQEIKVNFGDRRVTGWAGIMEAGKHSRAGFSVFRRRRLIEGSVGEAYRPRQVFGAHNSFASQRIVGELYVEGFDVSHTKDGIQWGEDEADIAFLIQGQLDTEEMPILDQADGYRVRKSASMLPPKFGEGSVDIVPDGANLDISTPKFPDVDPLPAIDLIPSTNTLQQRSFVMKVDDDQEWNVRVELVRDPAAEWLESVQVKKDGQDTLQIRVNLAHAFSEEHLNDNEPALAPILRLAVAISIGELQARLQGVKSAGSIRKNANALLRKGLSSAPMNEDKGE
jgi:hypothetical protein